MGVYIKGMQMPKDCPYCKMAHYNASDEFTGCDVVPNKRYAMHNDAVYAKSTQRPDWCPLVEVPAPHGDLIDRDALEADICPDWNGLYVPDNAYSEKLIRNAPTVIEAEEADV